MQAGRWRLGGLELDRASFSLRRGEAAIRLDPKPTELLLLLAERDGAVVSHDEALRAVWGGDVHIDGEAALYTAVKKIRRALAEHADVLENRLGSRLPASLSPQLP